MFLTATRSTFIKCKHRNFLHIRNNYFQVRSSANSAIAGHRGYHFRRAAMDKREQLMQAALSCNAWLYLNVDSVAPPDYSAKALARSVHGRFHHTAYPLIGLMGWSKDSHIALAGEVGSLSKVDPQTTPRVYHQELHDRRISRRILEHKMHGMHHSNGFRFQVIRSFPAQL
jgi:hypothetical protein